MKRGIRFIPYCSEWIKRGLKTTTFRKTKRNGIYEIVEGPWYNPKRTGLLIKCTPYLFTCKDHVIHLYYDAEGDFKSSEEFLEWLKQNNLTLPEEGWLNKIEFLPNFKSEEAGK